jgi:hypothetical protein
MGMRIQECKDRFSYLNEQFDRAINVQTLAAVERTSNAVEKLQAESSQKG